MATQFGYFLIADITGYTQYLSASELDHAQKTLTALLNLLINHTKPPLVISRLAGDAVISYGLRDSFCQGQTFLEMLEDTYVSFRRQTELMVLNTTCPCNACRNIGGLDLKFFVHFGEFGVQRLDGHDELVGSDVNMIHRLLKNSVSQATGFKAYTLYSDAAIRQLGLGEDRGALVSHTETYEHLGSVQLWVQDMHPVWLAKRDAMQVKIARDEELFRNIIEIAATPEQIWDHFLTADHFNLLLGGDRVAIVERRGARVVPGSVYQCYHGDAIIVNTVVGLLPFERFVIEYVVPVPFAGTTQLAEFRLEAAGERTQVIEVMSKARGSLLGRLAADTAMRGRQQGLLDCLNAFKALVEAERSAQRALTSAPAAIAAAEVSAAAREGLIQA